MKYQMLKYAKRLGRCCGLGLLLIANVAVADQGITSSTERSYGLSASAGMRMLAVRDDDPQNDRSLSISLGGNISLWPAGMRLMLRGGVVQQHSVEPGESSFFFQDTALGLSYSHRLSILSWQHRLRVYLPTSRQSRAQDMRFMLQVSSSPSIQIVPALTMALNVTGQYRNHQFAERAGMYGGMNTLAVLRSGLSLDYELPMPSARWGKMNFGAAVSTHWRWRYQSRDEHLSETSDARVWTQGLGWELYAEYTPVKVISAAVAVEHGDALLRNGIVQTRFLNRDLTEVVFRLTGRY